MSRKVRPQNTPNQQVDDSDDSSSSSMPEDSSEHYATHHPKEYVINPYALFPLPRKIVPVHFNADDIIQQFLKDSLEKFDGPKNVVPPSSFCGSKQLKPKVIEVDPKTSMEDKNNSNPKEDHQGVMLQYVGDEPGTKNGNQLNVEDESKLKKTASQLIEIKKIEEKSNLDILLSEKRFDSSGESSAPINNQKALVEEITKPKSDNSNDQTPSTSAPKEEEVKVIQETINPQLTDNSKKNNNKEGEFLSTLNRRILATPLLTPLGTKPEADLGSSSDKNNVLDIKNTPEFDTTKKEILSTKDIFTMCTPKTGAVPKQPKNTDCEKQNDKNNKISKNQKSTQADSKTLVVNTICNAFEEARMFQDFSNQTSIAAPSNGKVQSHVKAVDPRVNKGVKTAPKQFEEKYVLRDNTEKNKESKASVVKATDFKVVDEKEEHQQIPNQQKASEATKKKDKMVGNKTSGEATERKTKKKKVKDCGYLPPLRVTVPATTYTQLRRRLDKEPLYQVIFGRVMINIYSEEELVNIEKYYDEYLDELLPKKKFNDSRDE